MIDVVLLVARLLFVALLYLFLFAIMRTGVRQVSGASKKGKSWHLVVEKGPKELRGVNIPVTGPVIVGRAPGADIVIAAGYVSGRHARFQLMGENLFVEDLGCQERHDGERRLHRRTRTRPQQGRHRRRRRGHPREVRVMNPMGPVNPANPMSPMQPMDRRIQRRRSGVRPRIQPRV